MREPNQPWDDPGPIHVVNDGISLRYIESGQQATDMPNPFDDTLVK